MEVRGGQPQEAPIVLFYLQELGQALRVPEKNPLAFPAVGGESNHSEKPEPSASADPNLLRFLQCLTYLGGGRDPTPAPCSHLRGKVGDWEALVKFTIQRHSFTNSLKHWDPVVGNGTLPLSHTSPPQHHRLINRGFYFFLIKYIMSGFKQKITRYIDRQKNCNLKTQNKHQNQT